MVTLLRRTLETGAMLAQRTIDNHTADGTPISVAVVKQGSTLASSPVHSNRGQKPGLVKPHSWVP